MHITGKVRLHWLLVLWAAHSAMSALAGKPASPIIALSVKSAQAPLVPLAPLAGIPVHDDTLAVGAPPALTANVPSGCPLLEVNALIGPSVQPSVRDTSELDHLLDKISQQGLESLTSEERRVLEERSKELRQRD